MLCIYWGGKGGDKMFFFRSEKWNFKNSAFCGIIKINFLRAEKTLFYSTLSTLFVVACFVMC